MPGMMSNAAATSGIGIADDTVYYIMNGSNDKLLTPNSDNPNDIVSISLWPAQTWNNPRTKWMVDKQSNGKFKLTAFSGSGLVLRSYGTSLEVEYEEIDGSTDFDIIRVTDETHEGMYFIKWENKYFLYNFVAKS